MIDGQIAVVGRWAIASDGIQWIVQRLHGGRWRNISFVRSTRDILARCLREAGAGAADIDALLVDLPARFEPLLEAGAAWQRSIKSSEVPAAPRSPTPPLAMLAGLHDGVPA
jgi:hypothetical protein